MVIVIAEMSNISDYLKLTSCLSYYEEYVMKRLSSIWSELIIYASVFPPRIRVEFSFRVRDFGRKF